MSPTPHRPLRIALVNNRWFMVGGTTRYLFNVQRMLEQAGHTVIPFSNRYPQSVANPYLDGFVDPPGDPNAAFFGKAELTLARKWSLFTRGVYSPEVRRKLEALIDRHSIDLVYSINICNFLGPSVIDAARSRGIPYVMRLSDFNLLCPAYSFLRDGRPCEDCTGGLWHGVKNRCLQGSTAVSGARVMAMWIHRAMGIHHRVSRIVTPTSFLRTKLIEGGYDGANIEHIPTFVDATEFSPRGGEETHEVVMSGRLAPEKGPETVIDAMGRLSSDSRLRLVFLGAGDEGYLEQLQRRADDVAPGRVHFAGWVGPEEIIERVGRSRALLMPARWYENMPNAITEAMALARPVLASNIGSLPEQVVDGVTGRLLPVDDPVAWAAALDDLERHPATAREWGRAGRARVEAEFTPERHYERLMDVFEEVLPG